MRPLLTSLLLLATLSLAAQPFQLVFEKTFEANFFDYFRSSASKDFYLSADGSRIFINSDLRYSVLSATDGSLLGQGEHINKANALTNSLMGIIRNRSFNREDALNKARFDEGTEYLVFEEEGIVVFLDWNVNDNLVKAVDLNTGKELWQVSRYRYSSNSKEQFVDFFLSMSLNMRLNRNRPQDIAYKNARLQGFGEGVQTSNYASAVALGFMTPMQGTGAFMLRLADGTYVALDLRTGAEKWTYTRPINIGFAEMSRDGGLVIVNFVSSYLQKYERLILKLNPETGEEIWTASHLADFREGRTYLRGNRLVCDYYGVEVFDVATGERMLLSLDEKVVKTQNRMMAAFNSAGDGGRGTEAIASPSVVIGDRLYTSLFKLGKRAYANDGSSKAIVQAYDLNSGEMLWESGKLKAGTDLSFASEEYVFVRQGKAFGKSALFVLDVQTGEQLAETQTIDGFIYRAGAGDIFTERYLYRGGKKSIYAFDTEGWEQVHEFDTRKLKVGKLDAMLAAENALTTIGSRGMVFFDGQSGQAQAVETSRVYGSYWNDRFAFLFLQKKTLAIDLQLQKETGAIGWVPERPDDEFATNAEFLFSEDGNYLIVIREGEHLSLFENR